MLSQPAFVKLNNCSRSRSGDGGTNFRSASVLKVTGDHPPNYSVILGGCIDLTWKHASDSPRLVFLKLSNLQAGPGSGLMSPVGPETPEPLL